MRTVGSLLILIFCLHINIYAQDECTNNLKRAQKAYDEGSFDDVKKHMGSCLEKGFSTEEKLVAYKLLVLVSLFEDNTPEADRNMLKFLDTDPEYVINTAVDPAEFVYLYNQYKTLPIFSLGITLGANFSSVDLLEPYGIHQVNSIRPEYTYGGAGFHVGLRFNKQIFKNLSFDLEALFKTTRYELRENVFDFAETTIDERQSRLEIPIQFTYAFGNGKLKPYVGVGASFNSLFNASATPSRIYTDNALPEVKGQSLDVTEYRSAMNYAALGVVGVKYKVKRGSVFIEGRYVLGLNNAVTVDNRYQNQEFIFKYYHVDDDHYMNNIMVSMGYTYAFYNPKKRKVKK